MASNRLARQPFGMLKIRKDDILFELCLWEKKESKRKKKEDEQNRNLTSWFFSNLLNVSGTFGVNIALEYTKGK